MPPQITVKRIDHVSLVTPHSDRTTRFYNDLLGLLPLNGPAGGGKPAAGPVSMGDPHGPLLTVTEVAGGPVGRLGIGTVHHVALTVGSFDALLKWKRWLRHHEVLVYGPYDQQAYQDIVFTDPDGVILEIATHGPGWQATQDGQDVYAPPKQSMAPFRDEEAIRAQTWPHAIAGIEPDMALQGIHHIATIVSSLEDTDRFYREELALPLVRKSLDPDDPEVEQWFWGLDGGRPGTVMAAFPIVHAHEGGKAIHGRSGTGVVDRIALQVAVNESGSAGSPGRTDQAPVRSLRGPDGQVVDLIVATDPQASTPEGD